MVTTFNKKDLKSFYNYMVSDRRRDYYKNHPNTNIPSLEDRLKRIDDGDIERWMKWEREKKRQR